MNLKIFQLNIWAGTNFPAIKNFLEKNDFDILCFQEVAGIGTECGNVHGKIDCFDELKKVLGKDYDAQQVITDRYTSNPKTSYQSVAIFYKKHFQLLDTQKVFLHTYKGLYPSDAKSFEDMTRAFLDIQLLSENKSFHIVTTHLAWGKDKNERPHQREQNLKLINYMQTLQKPWILTGDFNIDPNQQSIVDLEKFSRDLTKEYNVANTVDPTMHVHWDKIKPGFPIDYIFVSPDITVKDFNVLNTVHLSDHFGLVAEIEV